MNTGKSAISRKEASEKYPHWDSLTSWLEIVDQSLGIWLKKSLHNIVFK